MIALGAAFLLTALLIFTIGDGKSIGVGGLLFAIVATVGSAASGASIALHGIEADGVAGARGTPRSLSLLMMVVAAALTLFIAAGATPAEVDLRAGIALVAFCILAFTSGFCLMAYFGALRRPQGTADCANKEELK